MTSVNKFMHPRNIYRVPPDFKELAVHFPEFRKHAIQDISGKVTLDFKNPEALLVLTQTLLKRDFNLEIDIPSNRLIPTLPLRLNYILWIEDLLTADSAAGGDVWGIDIGTGASCIYPLLGCKKNNWKFLATEVDDTSVKYAQENVIRNQLQDRITVISVTKDTVIEKVVNSNKNEAYNFAMCNPPFYISENESEGSWKKARPHPSSINTACKTEKLADGGEVKFVQRIIEESVKLGTNVRIYTTMLGKKSSLTIVKDQLKALSVPHLATTEFCQGKTLRWGIAWTFLDHINLEKIKPTKKRKEKPPLTLIIPKSMKDKKHSVQNAKMKFELMLKDLQIQFTELESNKQRVKLQLMATENTWIHQRRKRRALIRQQTALQIKTESSSQDSCDQKSQSSVLNMEVTGRKSKHQDNVLNKTSVCSNGEEMEDECKNICSLPKPILQSSVLNMEVTGRSCVDSIQSEPQDNVLNKSSVHSNEEKMEVECNNICSLPKLILKCNVTLRRVGHSVVLELKWLEGSLGKNGACQLFQYFKNKL